MTKQSLMHPVMRAMQDQQTLLTPKGRILSDYVRENPRKAVFMTTKELAKVCKVSEATVVRFVSQLGYSGYAEFLQALRDYVDAELTLLDRTDLSTMNAPGTDRLRRVVSEELDNLKQFYETVSIDNLNGIVEQLKDSPSIYVVGSRLSYTFAYYFGWSLTKIRSNVHILKGSDTTSIDWLGIAPATSVVVIIATSRYPNELIRLGKLVRRLGLQLIVITDSPLCPMIQFAHRSLVAPSKHIPFIGSPTTISCIINYLVLEIARSTGSALARHQQKLEQIYRENDILFYPAKDSMEPV